MMQPHETEPEFWFAVDGSKRVASRRHRQSPHKQQTSNVADRSTGNTTIDICDQAKTANSQGIAHLRDLAIA
jgi:hypothetical protein